MFITKIEREREREREREITNILEDFAPSMHVCMYMYMLTFCVIPIHVYRHRYRGRVDLVEWAETQCSDSGWTFC